LYASSLFLDQQHSTWGKKLSKLQRKMIRWEKDAVDEAEQKRKESDPCGENIPEPPITRWEQEERKSLLWSPFKTKAIRDSLLKGTLERLGHWGEYHYMGFHTTDKDCQI
jgi:hypothetical protein